ncbi:putative bifunctional diguanylate cyclase/phosphodiesterase [Deinococcus ruber]|uniref:Uncharacterized protein n=1 Tax=Deinococcus ruber TaxID=1848197 RepID=A0A918CHR0_9DEIO|nr:EAL domain-containing protein [Deinococcus ruber]GGR23534.1 hypothetical protein GCM10008957_39260 [Deinococcus ruber]
MALISFLDDTRQWFKANHGVLSSEVPLRQALHDVRHPALHDPLTGLPNRVQLRQRLLDACRRADASGEPVVVGLLDLDRFKLINDAFGHLAGDPFLRDVARRLQEATSTGDVVACMNGDEFVLLFTDMRSVADLMGVISRLEEHCAAPFLDGDQAVFAHWSLGLSVYPDDTQALDALLSQADAAMYRVKRAGGGSSACQARHWATERDALRPYVQPIVHAGCRTVEGHEARVRWITPTGLVSPLEFIPLVETSGVIVAIGRWVLQQAVDARRSGHLQHGAVNVSALELQQTDFVEQLPRVVEDSGIDPWRLWLELTDTSVVEPHLTSVLQAVGVRTALDHFGTGYSSLTALARLPVQLLKIDRSFVTESGQATSCGHQALNVIQGTVTLASTYGLPTVVEDEGIETAAQADLLTQVGCSNLQGSQCGRPASLL